MKPSDVFQWWKVGFLVQTLFSGPNHTPWQLKSTGCCSPLDWDLWAGWPLYRRYVLSCWNVLLSLLNLWKYPFFQSVAAVYFLSDFAPFLKKNYGCAVFGAEFAPNHGGLWSTCNLSFWWLWEQSLTQWTVFRLLRFSDPMSELTTSSVNSWTFLVWVRVYLPNYFAINFYFNADFFHRDTQISVYSRFGDICQDRLLA